MAATKSLLLLFFGDPTTDRRVQNFERLFREAGWSVELLTIVSTHERGPLKFASYHSRLMKAVSNKRAAVVMACDLYSLSAARWMKRHGQARMLIYDAREVYTELPAVANRPLRRAVWKRTEQQGLAASDIVIVTAPHDLQAILHAHGFVPRSVLVRNVPWKNDALIRDRSRLQQFGIPAGANVAVYLGGLQSGRGLETIILSIESISSIDVHLLLIGDGALRASLEQQTNNLHLAERVHFAGAIASDDALQIAAACDAGLAIVEPISKSYELALPSKLFEYMMAGLPVVINTMRHVHELFGEQPWLIQVNPSDVNSIANGIERAIARSKDSAITQEEQRIALDRYHFEADAASLIAQIEQHLALST